MEAQNIIVNGSFEELIGCPGNPAGIGYAQPWNAGEGSPDLFNVCGLYDWGIPVNWGGVQWPRTGDGYASIATYSVLFHDARETLWQPIRYPLIGGEEYYFEMYVSLRDSSRFATHNIGIVFEDTVIDEQSNLECLFQCQPVVENTSSNPLTSRTDWIKVSGEFTAVGGEKYIHIGNLRDDSSTQIEYVDGGGGTDPIDWEYALYYIDDVWLSHIDSMHHVGVGEIEKEIGFEIFPNPSLNGMVTVECNLKGGEEAELRVFDMSGRQVYRNGNVCGANVVKLEGLSEGIYHCLLVVNGKASLSEKLVILRE